MARTQRDSAFSGVLSVLTWALLLVVVAAVAVLVVLPKALGGTTLTVLTGSMEPTFSPGDVVAVTTVTDADAQVQLGDVITFQPVSGDPTLVTHRVVAKSYTSDGVQFVTRGDANGADDEPLVAGQVKARVLYSVPLVGHASLWLGERKGLFVALAARRPPGLRRVHDPAPRAARLEGRCPERGLPGGCPPRGRHVRRRVGRNPRHRRHGRWRHMTWRRIVTVGVSAALLAGAAAGLTYAFWGDAAAATGAVVRTGDLDLVLVGSPTWTETSPDVSPAHAVAMQADGITAAHLATPGDSFTVAQQFRTVLDGDNLAARLTVRWDTAPALLPTGQVTATYRVTRPDGVVSAATPVGTTLTLPGSGGNLTPAQTAAWGSTPWTLTVSLAYTGADVMVPPASVGSGPVTSLGTVTVSLDQVRTGTGFTP